MNVQVRNNRILAIGLGVKDNDLNEVFPIDEEILPKTEQGELDYEAIFQLHVEIQNNQCIISPQSRNSFNSFRKSNNNNNNTQILKNNTGKINIYHNDSFRKRLVNTLTIGAMLALLISGAFFIKNKLHGKNNFKEKRHQQQ